MYGWFLFTLHKNAFRLIDFQLSWKLVLWLETESDCRILVPVARGNLRPANIWSSEYDTDLSVTRTALLSRLFAGNPALGMDGPQGRSMFNIVWGCLSTTFICAWVSVHPNIPPPKYEEYGWKSLSRRLWLMFWTLVTPELVLLWSFRQWMAAGKIARIYNERNSGC